MGSCHRVSPGGYGLLKTQSTAPFPVWGGRCVVFCGSGASAVSSTEKREGRPAAGPWRCGMHHPSRAAVPDAARIMPFGRPAAPRRDSLRPGSYKTISSRARKLRVVYNIQPKIRASCRAGRRAAGVLGTDSACSRADKQRKSRPAFSPWERRWQPQTSRPDKIGGIIHGNLHRISHPFHSGMFIYTGALRSAKETERYIGGTKI